MITIRQFSHRGSETRTYHEAEAERIAAAHWEKGGLVIDVAAEEVIQRGSPLPGSLLFLDPIVGG